MRFDVPWKRFGWAQDSARDPGDLLPRSQESPGYAMLPACPLILSSMPRTGISCSAPIKRGRPPRRWRRSRCRPVSGGRSSKLRARAMPARLRCLTSPAIRPSAERGTLKINSAEAPEAAQIERARSAPMRGQERAYSRPANCRSRKRAGKVNTIPSAASASRVHNTVTPASGHPDGTSHMVLDPCACLSQKPEIDEGA
jgi:hypothetical protein